MIIDNVDFHELPAQKYWSFPSGYKKDSKAETQNMIFSGNYVGARKMDGAFYKFIKDENGNINRVGTNVFTINKIISDIPVYIQEELEREENSSFKIPLGSFLGSKLFSGMGPKVNVKMKMVGDLDTDLRSEFTSAGINQTLHRIYLEIKCKVIILTPFETMEEEIANQVLIAEGVIVGDIPNAYYNLDGITKDNAIDIIE